MSSAQLRVKGSRDRKATHPGTAGKKKDARTGMRLLSLALPHKHLSERFGLKFKVNPHYSHLR